MDTAWPSIALALICAAIAGCGGGSDAADPTAPARPAADPPAVGCAEGGTSTAARCAQRARGMRGLSREPYLGVACPEANSIACDRVGLAVWLTRPAARVTATIEGRPLRLRAGRADGRGAWYRGYLQPAGLLDGPLKVTPDRGGHFWQGSHPKDAQVRITIRRSDATTDRASLTVPLRAGWG